MREDHLVLISRLDAFCIHDTPSGRGQIPDSAFVCAVDIVREREESIAGTGHAFELGRPFLPLGVGEGFGDSLEQRLPMLLLSTLQDLPADVQVDGIGLLSTFDTALEWQGQSAGVVAQPPVVGFVAGKPGTVNTGLLASSETDDCTTERVCNAVGLCVFEGQSGYDEVSARVVGEL